MKRKPDAMPLPSPFTIQTETGGHYQHDFPNSSASLDGGLEVERLKKINAETQAAIEQVLGLWDCGYSGNPSIGMLWVNNPFIEAMEQLRQAANRASREQTCR